MSTVPRNLIVCCDGTNNLWSASDDVTNVVKIVRRLQRTEQQLCYYDPGVGSASGQLHESSGIKQRLGRLAGLAWGNGVWRNVADAYQWLARTYQDRDRVYLVGFSRGAFTVRALAGLLYWCHLPRPNCEHLIPTFIDAYRVSDSDERRKICRELRHFHSRSPSPDVESFPIEFIGVFDTVESVGLQQIFFDTEVISDNKVKKGVQFVRHAMAIDEARWTFEPRPYLGLEDESPTGSVPRLKQVWFPGAHSDVGGGYAEPALSDVVLYWMLEELLSLPHPPLLVNDWESNLKPDARGHRHDQMRQSPLWALTGRCHRAMLDEKNATLTISQATVDRLQSTDWRPPSADNTLKIKIEPYGPRLAQRLGPPPEASRPEVCDNFLGARWRGFIAVLAWMALCFLPNGARDLARLQLTEIFQHQAALTQLVGTFPWFGNTTLALPVGTWLALDVVAILLAAYWMSIGMTAFGEKSGGQRSYGIFLTYAAPTALIADLIENLFTSFLAGPWITPAFLGSTFLGLPTPWISFAISALISLASVVKLVAYTGTILVLLWMAVSRKSAQARNLWLAKIAK